MAEWKRYRATTYKVEPKRHGPSGSRYYHWTVVQGSRRIVGDATEESTADANARAAIDRLQDA